jgi:hypothetical protein
MAFLMSKCVKQEMIKDNNKNYDNYIKKGWEEIPKLYDNSTITFLISFYLK